MFLPLGVHFLACLITWGPPMPCAAPIAATAHPMGTCLQATPALPWHPSSEWPWMALCMARVIGLPLGLRSLTHLKHQNQACGLNNKQTLLFLCSALFCSVLLSCIPHWDAPKQGTKGCHVSWIALPGPLEAHKPSPCNVWPPQ